MRTIRALFWTLLGFCLAALLLLLLGDCRAVEPVYIADVAPRLVHRAHMFHGISFSTLDHDTGERWFERNGKRCPLFTDAFWKKEGK